MCKGKLRKRWTCDVIDSYNQTLGFTYDKIHERPYCKVRIMTKEIVLFGIFSVLHLIVICTITRENYLFLPSKILPILLLIFTLGKSWTNLAKKGKLILIALVFSLFGDSFLALPGSGYFVPGLGSFLIAQLIYAYAFSLGWSELIYKNILNYQVSPYLQFPKTQGFVGIPGLTFTLVLNF